MSLKVAVIIHNPFPDISLILVLIVTINNSRRCFFQAIRTCQVQNKGSGVQSYTSPACTVHLPCVSKMDRINTLVTSSQGVACQCCHMFYISPRASKSNKPYVCQVTPWLQGHLMLRYSFHNPLRKTNTVLHDPGSLLTNIVTSNYSFVVETHFPNFNS